MNILKLITLTALIALDIKNDWPFLALLIIFIFGVIIFKQNIVFDYFYFSLSSKLKLELNEVLALEKQFFNSGEAKRNVLIFLTSPRTNWKGNYKIVVFCFFEEAR